MTLAHGASIVTDGSLLLVDAANPRSYPGTGTTWRDLSGNGNDGTLVGPPTYSTSGYFSFGGGTQRADFGTLQPTISTFSMVCWIYRTARIQYSGVCMWSAPCGIGIGLSPSSLYLDSLGFRAAGGDLLNSGLSVPLDQWCMVALSVGETSATLYLNQNSVTQAQSVVSFTSSSFQLAYSDGTGAGLAGRISSAQVYNRALSTTEIQQNFNAYRGRYGI